MVRDVTGSLISPAGARLLMWVTLTGTPAAAAAAAAASSGVTVTDKATSQWCLGCSQTRLTPGDVGRPVTPGLWREAPRPQTGPSRSVSTS